jgi:TolB-like protein/DNA-binding winged helix-turn-helix (wHTH) protein/Flp pilus assembly protein TadD
MTHPAKALYEFFPFCLDPVKQVLLRNGTMVPLTQKAFATLLVLLEQHGRTVDKEELISRVWQGVVVEENNLNQCISALRKALGERRDDHRFILTVPGRGYRFVAEVRESEPGPPAQTGHEVRDQSAGPQVLLESTPEQHQKKRWGLIVASLAGILLAFVIAGLWRMRELGRQRHGGPAPASVAVLPFLNLSGKSENEYLSDGVTEELTTALAEVHGLRVVARTSAFEFRRKGEDVRKIGEQLNVGTVMEGSVSRSGNKLHVTAQLINTQNGYHLWSGTYDGERSEIYAVEEQIVRQTIRTLGIAATGQEQTGPKGRTENPEAHDLYLEGRYLWNKRDLPDMEKSIQLFGAAIREDPNYALAYAGLADTYVVLAGNGQKPYADVMPRARAALDRVLELDSNLPQAQIIRAMLISPWDTAKVGEFRRATELSPGYATAHHWYGVILSGAGRFQEADAELRQAQILDPLSPMITEDLAENFYYWRRYDSAIEQARRIRQMGSSLGDPVLGLAYIQKGMYPDAITVFRALPQEDEAGKNLTYLACAYAASGQREEALKLLSQASTKGYVPPFLTARVYVLLGEKDIAFRWLQKAYQQTDATTAIKVDPIMDPIRSDPRYAELLKKTGLAD